MTDGAIRTLDARLKALAEIVRGVVLGLHNQAPDHGECALRDTDACAYYSPGAIERLDEIING